LRYDVCIIGGGAEGLAAAAWLAGRGLKTVVAERNAECGGRCTTREFHPGFRVSPFADELASIPADIFRALDLARRGAVLTLAEPCRAPPPEVEAIRQEVVKRVMEDAARSPSRGWFAKPEPSQPWPGEELAARTLAGMAGAPRLPMTGMVCDPTLAGSALAVLAGRPGGMPAGGLGRLAAALRSAAEEAGAEISCGLEVTDIRRKDRRILGVGLGDGSEIAARAIISTLDLRRTFLSLFAWNELPPELVERVAAFRLAPGTARLLVALEAPPDPPAGRGADVLRRPIPVAPAPLEDAYRAWRSATVPEHPPAAVRLVTAVDPFLAPDGAATLTVTLGAIPHTPFDGAWTKEKRDGLRGIALAAAETALPGTMQRVKYAELLVPPDMESMIGATEGDLMGGELSASQMLGFRPFLQCRGTRTPVEGLYLAGPSSALGPLATCASGIAAAAAVLADFAAGRLK
jgi:phytoene dehydrogenase-like protein